MSDDSKSGPAQADGGLNRRSFMRRTGVGMAAAGGAAAAAIGAASTANAANTPLATTAKTPGVAYDVVVIGGGFAGVTAARDARKAGYRTLILEARDRLGGRTHTAEFAGHKIELGGTWIHWSQPFVWAEKERYSLELLETPVDGSSLDTMEFVVKVGNTTQRLSGEQLMPLMEAFGAYFEEARQIWDRPFDAKYGWREILARDKLSARQRMDQLKLTPLQRAALESYVCSMAHGSLDQASYVDMARWWSLPGWNLQGFSDAIARYKFKHGTSALIQAMVTDGKPEVRLSTPVRKVEDRGSQVVVTTASGEAITAAAVVIALPMNVLPSVEFSPPLDAAVVEAGRQKHTGSGVKFFVKAKGRYSKMPNVTAMADASYPINVVLTHAVDKDHTLFCAFGADPKKIDVSDIKSIEKLMKAFFPDIRVESTFGHQWTDDPYAQGTFASYKREWFGKYYDKFQKDRGRILFGQGDHGEGWRGFIDGAIGAGARAAQRLHKILG